MKIPPKYRLLFSKIELSIPLNTNYIYRRYRVKGWWTPVLKREEVAVKIITNGITIGAYRLLRFQRMLEDKIKKAGTNPALKHRSIRNC